MTLICRLFLDVTPPILAKLYEVCRPFAYETASLIVVLSTCMDLDDVFGLSGTKSEQIYLQPCKLFAPLM